jgi:hypothetical protein
VRDEKKQGIHSFLICRADEKLMTVLMFPLCDGSIGRVFGRLTVDDEIICILFWPVVQ